MKNMTWSVALMVAVMLPVGVGAQKSKGDKTDKKGKDSAYTGCIEAGRTAGTFVLTHVAADPMGNDFGKKSAKGKRDTSAPTTIALTSASVDLSTHLGHKVSVTGSAAAKTMDPAGRDTNAKDALVFTVKSLKMVATSCS